MTEKLKEIVENANIQRKGSFRRFFILSNGEYDGFWGRNGYDSLKLFAYNEVEDEWFILTDYADVFSICSINGINVSVDIPSDLGIPVFCTSRVLYVDNTPDLSTVIGEVK